MHNVSCSLIKKLNAKICLTAQFRVHCDNLCYEASFSGDFLAKVQLDCVAPTDYAISLKCFNIQTQFQNFCYFCEGWLGAFCPISVRYRWHPHDCTFALVFYCKMDYSRPPSTFSFSFFSFRSILMFCLAVVNFVSEHGHGFIVFVY